MIWYTYDIIMESFFICKELILVKMFNSSMCIDLLRILTKIGRGREGTAVEGELLK